MSGFKSGGSNNPNHLSSQSDGDVKRHARMLAQMITPDLASREYDAVISNCKLLITITRQLQQREIDRG